MREVYCTPRTPDPGSFFAMAVMIRCSDFQSDAGYTLKNKKQTGQLTEQQFNIRLSFQSKELEEHKYYLSEQQGFDVGLKQSATDWVSSGQAKRFACAFSKNQEGIYTFCALNCDDKNCIGSCTLPVKEIHNLIGDLE